MTRGLRSGQVAEAAGVNVETLRYYERRGSSATLAEAWEDTACTQRRR